MTVLIQHWNTPHQSPILAEFSYMEWEDSNAMVMARTCQNVADLIYPPHEVKSVNILHLLLVPPESVITTLDNYCPCAPTFVEGFTQVFRDLGWADLDPKNRLVIQGRPYRESTLAGIRDIIRYHKHKTYGLSAKLYRNNRTLTATLKGLGYDI